MWRRPWKSRKKRLLLRAAVSMSIRCRPEQPPIGRQRASNLARFRTRRRTNGKFENGKHVGMKLTFTLKCDGVRIYDLRTSAGGHTPDTVGKKCSGIKANRGADGTFRESAGYAKICSYRRQQWQGVGCGYGGLYTTTGGLCHRFVHVSLYCSV
ncbi:hypothetical protein SDC9_188290 [bioreactor metagenome]|uniref:Uncharacterized protein n=1 Tax=bioreactor metagenome TaxID=1076179 RepID=A0A645HNY0_9ZZZZ